MDLGDFKIPQLVATPSTKRVSEWTPGSGFSGSNIETMCTNKGSKQMAPKAKRSDPVSTTRGGTLDLTTRLETTDLIKDSRDIRRKQGLAKGKAQKENGILLFDSISTKLARGSVLCQPAGHPDENDSTEQLRKVASSA